MARGRPVGVERERTSAQEDAATALGHAEVGGVEAPCAGEREAIGELTCGAPKVAGGAGPIPSAAIGVVGPAEHVLGEEPRRAAGVDGGERRGPAVALVGRAETLPGEPAPGRYLAA